MPDGPTVEWHGLILGNSLNRKLGKLFSILGSSVIKILTHFLFVLQMAMDAADIKF